MTVSINTIEAKEQFTDLVNRVAHQKERIVLTRRGKEIAVIIPFEELQLLQASQDKQDVREAIDALQEVRHTGTVSIEQLKENLGV